MVQTLAALIITACISGYAGASDQRIPDTPDHHTDNGFRNPHITQSQSEKTIFSFLKMRLTTDEWADHAAQGNAVPSQKVNLEKVYAPYPRPQITWIGHSTFLIQYHGINILTDPVFSKRASPLSFAGPERYTDPALTIEQLPPIDLAIISHNHYDHLDADTVKRLGNSTRWLVPLGHREWFAELGVDRVIEFDWWDEFKTPSLTVTATPSQHWSARGLNDRLKALWASWVLDFGDFRLWFAGDTGYNDKHFREIGDLYGHFDLALIPIGGYAPRWFMGPMHVNPQEAVQIHLDIHAKRSVGMHWGTFPLTAEPVIEPVTQLSQALQQANLPPQIFTTFKIGETRYFDNCRGRNRLVKLSTSPAAEC